MKYKVLVLDIDGTLRNSKKQITPKTKEAILKLQEDGVKIVVASGRPTYGVMPTARELKMEQYGGYILSFNGGKIVNCATGKTIYEKRLPLKYVSRLADFAKAFDSNMLSYDGEMVITNEADDPYVQIESRINGMRLKKVDDFGDYDEQDMNKCIIVSDSEVLEDLEPRAQKVFGDKMNIYRSEPYFLEVMPSAIDKAYSLKKLLEELGYTKEEMVACGDGFNDVTMIRYAGMGVAMANAQDPVKEAADFITKSCDEDGVAYAIEKLFYENAEEIQ